MPARVDFVLDDKKRGLVAQLKKSGDATDEEVGKVLGDFVRPWEWASDESAA